MAILMTGLTGVLGSVIGPELAEETFFLVRGGGDNKRIPKGVNLERIIAGDITKHMGGLSDTNLRLLKLHGVDRIIHLAADVSFALVDTDGNISMTNFTGTRNMVQLAKRLGVREFHYCSTAFGPLRRNPYEQSKMDAEALIPGNGFAWSVYRPSAMVGDSLTGVISDFNGFYGVYGVYHALAQRIRAKEMRLLGEVSMPIFAVCSSTSTINLIQTDWVRDTMLKLLKRGVKNEIYHITHPHPLLARAVYQFGFDVLGIKDVKYLEEPISVVHHDRRWRVVQKALDEILIRYIPYVTYEEKFSLKTLQDTLGEEYADPPEITAEFIYKLLKYAVEKNFGRDKVERNGHARNKNGQAVSNAAL